MKIFDRLSVRSVVTALSRLGVLVSVKRRWCGGSRWRPLYTPGPTLTNDNRAKCGGSRWRP